MKIILNYESCKTVGIQYHMCKSSANLGDLLLPPDVWRGRNSENSDYGEVETVLFLILRSRKFLEK